MVLKISLIFLFVAAPVYSKINSLSPWSLQAPISAERKKISQTLQLQVGISGVSPMGGESDVKFYSVPYQISYGLLNNLEIGAGWGAQVLQRKGKGTQAGISDISLGGRYKILEVDRSLKLPGVELELGFSAPVASYERGLGTGGLGILFQWGIELPTNSVKSYFGAGYRYFQENSDNVQVGSILSYYIGILKPVSEAYLSSERWKMDSLTFEIKGLTHSRNKTSGREGGVRPDEFYAAPGLILKKKHYRLTGSVLGGLTKESSDFGITLGMNF